MGRPKGRSKKPETLGSTENRRIAKRTKNTATNSIGRFFNSQANEHNLKLGVNIFDQLNIIEKDNKQTNNKPGNQPKNQKKPPPVVLTGKNTDIDKILKENGIENFNMKNISIGTKVFVNNDNDFEKISSYLQQNGIDYYSHGRKDQRICKVVITGLPEMSTKLIEEELANLNIHPLQVIQMKTLNPNPHRALYLIHLNGKETTFQDVQKIKSVHHTIIKWSKYKPRPRGPTQCRNCSMYGHGTQNCHRKPTCTLCASNEHNQMVCPLRQLPKDSSPVFKCSYCTINNIQPSNHRASDANCPGRKIYVNLRKSLPASQTNNKTNQQRHSYQYNRNQFAPAPAPPPLTQSYKNVLVNECHDDHYQQHDNSGTQDLFSTAELFSIFTDAIQDIRNCRSKLDQIQVIAKLINHVLQ